MKKIILPLALASVTLAANAAFISGDALLAKINGNATELTDGMHYVAGAFDAYAGTEEFCAPSNITLAQVTDMVRVQLVTKPALRHVAADLFVLTTLKSAWPCESKHPTKRALNRG